MTRDSLFERYGMFTAAGVLGAYGITSFQGFRQLDVKFMIEIFSNWVESAEESSTLSMQNNQIRRYLEKLVEEGFARKSTKKQRPVYKLTPLGVLELLSRMVEREHFNPREHFFFVYFFIHRYRRRLIGYIKQTGTRFPYALQMELEKLLNPKILIERQIQHTEERIRQLRSRIEENQKISSIVKSLREKGKNYYEIVQLIDKAVPYSFNTQRRFAEVFQMGTDVQGMWELEVGALGRTLDIWRPSLGLMESHLKELITLRDELTLEEKDN